MEHKETREARKEQEALGWRAKPDEFKKGYQQAEEYILGTILANGLPKTFDVAKTQFGDLMGARDDYSSGARRAILSFLERHGQLIEFGESVLF